ncbi:hypothetical protein [Bacillus mycoides]|uniref:hypothetical protein n=1 Tax=Bacillus mycoides TaxID=1405 RepID=UPI0037FD78CA
MTGFSIGNDCPFPAIVLAGRERIATEFLTKETANEVADLVHGEVISIKYKVTQEIKRKWVGV